MAERNAEIDRRIDERLAAKRQADEQERLARERADLLARERELEARENTFATMVARLSAQQQQSQSPEETAGETDASSNLATESYAAPETYSTYPSYSTYPDTSGQYDSEPDGYVSSAGPYFDPYYCPPTTFVSIVNQSIVLEDPRHNYHRHDGGQHHRNNLPNDNVPAVPARPAPPTELRPPVLAQRPPVVTQRLPVVTRPPVMTRPVPVSPPVRSFVPRSTHPTGSTQMVARRPAAAKPILPQTP